MSCCCPTAEGIQAILGPIESLDNLDIVFHPASRKAVLDLPRYALQFTIVEGESTIMSKHYSGMCIDECQSVGTLVGLAARLVLRQEDSPQPSTAKRIVLVPRGSVSSEMAKDHVWVTVDLSEASHVKHDAFTVDPKIGQLTGSGSLSSTLYLCLLHALTSHHLPDPLTGRTGTEEALRILESASVRSFQRLDPESHSLL